MNRRQLLRNMVASAAVAFAVTTNLGRHVLEVIKERLHIVGDGVTDDHFALQAFIDGEEVVGPQGELLKHDGGNVRFPSGNYKISDMLIFAATLESVVMRDTNLIASQQLEGPMIDIQAPVRDVSLGDLRKQGRVFENNVYWDNVLNAAIWRDKNP